MEIKKERLKNKNFLLIILLAGVLIGGVVVIGSWAQKSIIDSFSNTSKIATSSNLYLQTSSGIIKLGKSSASATTCSANEECSSGFCVDGYCCNSSCTDICKACSISGSEGACTSVSAGKVFIDGVVTDANSTSTACDGSYDYWGSVGGCTYNTRFAECDGSGLCDEDASNYFTNATTSVTISNVITVAVAGGTSIPTIGAATSTGSACDGSYDNYANANECTYSKRYAECNGDGTCDATSTTNYAGNTTNVPSSNYSVAQSGGTGNPYTAGGITTGCTQTGCCSGATKTCTGGGIFGACSIVADETYLSATENGSWDHNCNGATDHEYTAHYNCNPKTCSSSWVTWSCGCGNTCLRGVAECTWIDEACQHYNVSTLDRCK